MDFFDQKLYRSIWRSDAFEAAMRIRFLSKNKHKIAETKAILDMVGVEIVPVQVPIDELQTTDLRKLVQDKCIKAYRLVGRPLIVEHTALEIDALNKFPGGLTQIFWDTIQADRFAQLFGGGTNNRISARTQIGYCDSREIYHFAGEIHGTVPSAPRGDPAFQWDCVFVPDGETQTFAEMGPARKNAISMRRQALDQLADFVRKHHASR